MTTRTITPHHARPASAEGASYTAGGLADVDAACAELRRVAAVLDGMEEPAYLTVHNLFRNHDAGRTRTWTVSAIVSVAAGARLSEPVCAHACDPEMGVTCAEDCDAGPREQAAESDLEQKLRRDA